MTAHRTLVAAVIAVILAGCAHHGVDIDMTPPIIPPAIPQQTLAVVPLNDRSGALVAAVFHDDLKGAIRQTQGFQVIDYGGPWPASCGRPMPGQPVDLRRLVAEIQQVCPSDHTLLYEVTQVSPVRPIRLGVRVMMIRSGDGSVVLDYDGVWEGPVAPPAPIPRGGVVGWFLPPIIPPHDPLSEVSPRILGLRASRDIALMLTGAGAPPPPAPPPVDNGTQQDPGLAPPEFATPDSLVVPSAPAAPLIPPSAPPTTSENLPLPDPGIIE